MIISTIITTLLFALGVSLIKYSFNDELIHECLIGVIVLMICFTFYVVIFKESSGYKYDIAYNKKRVEVLETLKVMEEDSGFKMTILERNRKYKLLMEKKYNKNKIRRNINE